MADDSENDKDGFTIGEIENKVRKYGLEITLCVVFILTAIFALVWSGAMIVWSIILSMIFGIVGGLVPKSIHKVTTHSMRFVFREKVTAIIAAVVAILVSIFVPPIIFAIVGLWAGKAISLDANMHGASFDGE